MGFQFLGTGPFRSETDQLQNLFYFADRPWHCITASTGNDTTKKNLKKKIVNVAESGWDGAAMFGRLCRGVLTHALTGAAPCLEKPRYGMLV